MKKTLLFIAMLFAGMLIAGTIDESTRQLESQPNKAHNEKTNCR